MAAKLILRGAFPAAHQRCQPKMLTCGRLRELTRAMRTTARLNGNLHRACRAIFHVGYFCSRFSELIDCPDQKKNGGRDNEKIDQERNEVAVIPRDRSGFGGVRGSIECRRAVFGRPKNDKFIGEIESAGEETDWRHDDVFNQRIDD
jgi:hypothetical protein